jgi:hypothetical protein
MPCRQGPGKAHTAVPINLRLLWAMPGSWWVTDLKFWCGELHLSDSSITSHVLEGQPDPAFIRHPVVWHPDNDVVSWLALNLSAGPSQMMSDSSTCNKSDHWSAWQAASIVGRLHAEPDAHLPVLDVHLAKSDGSQTLKACMWIQAIIRLSIIPSGWHVKLATIKLTSGQQAVEAKLIKLMKHKMMHDAVLTAGYLAAFSQTVLHSSSSGSTSWGTLTDWLSINFYQGRMR